MNLKPRTAWALLLVVSVLSLAGAASLISLGAGGPDNSTQTAPPSGFAVNPSTSPGNPGASPEPTGEGGTVASNPTPEPQPTPPFIDKEFEPKSAEPEELTGYGWPLKRAWITSKFGPRDFGTFIIVDGVEFHDGLDLATHCGDKVYAAHDGVVLANDRTFDQYLGYQGHPEEIFERLQRLGRVNALAIGVVIDDGNGYRSQYIHLKEATVEVGQFVRRGDQIGIEGETGAARGCHVHYALIRMDGEWQDVLPGLWKYGYPERIREHVDPMDVLPWGDDWAPRRLYNQVHPPPPTPTPASPPPPSATPSPAPTGSGPTPTPSASPRP